MIGLRELSKRRFQRLTPQVGDVVRAGRSIPINAYVLDVSVVSDAYLLQAVGYPDALPIWVAAEYIYPWSEWMRWHS